MSSPCSIQSCPCLSCPQILQRKKELFKTFQRRISNPLYKTMISLEMILFKPDIEYLYTLMEDDLYPHGHQITTIDEWNIHMNKKPHPIYDPKDHKNFKD